MSAIKGRRCALVLWAVVGCCCVPEAAFAKTVKPAPPIADVRLEDSGLLLGQLVTPQNLAVTGAEVALWSGPTKLSAAKTNQGGYFAFKGLRNGVYQIETPKGQVAYRVWTKDTAPPAAQPGTLIVVGDKTVLGQYSLGGGQFLRDALSNPWIVTAVVTTAVAVPVAIHNSGHRHASSP